MQAPDRGVQLSGVAAREIAARGADIRREQGVTDEHVAIDAVGEAVGGMPGGGQHFDAQAARLDHVAVLQQGIERSGDGGIAGRDAEHAAEMRLHLADAGADQHRGRGPRAQERGRTQVVGMGVGLEDPVHVQRSRADAIQQRACTCAGHPPGPGVVVQHRVDHHRIASAAGHVAPGAGVDVEEGLDVQAVVAHDPSHSGGSSPQ
jgi:hypothetical protein